MSSSENHPPTISPAVPAHDELRPSPQGDDGFFLPAPFSLLLQNYFRSGWAFLIPYLAAYLLYAWLKWPVNPAEAGSTEQGATIWTPCLLHIYWGLHAIHVVLGVIALRAWWLSSSVLRPHFTVLQKSAPWILMGLLIWIPGAYLEFPADPIAHMGRIVAWAQASHVIENNIWLKSSYFLAYSISCLGQPEALELLLRLYYTGMCLLLSWQCYRLALVMNLGIPSAFLFAALQLVIFGNSTFSYHRYYGLSSTIVSHFAAVALLRIWIAQISAPQFIRALGGTLFASISLLALVVLNHIQEVLIVLVSLVALGFWWLSRHNKIVLVMLFALLAAMSAALMAQHSLMPPATLTELQKSGWLNSVGAFNLLQGESPAHHRLSELIGVFGLVGGILALLMFWRNHVGAWLMTVPWAFLMLPATAYPLALYLYGDAPGFIRWFPDKGLEHMSVFSRQLFAMPLALPFAWLFSILLKDPYWTRLAPAIPLGTVLVLLALPTQNYSHARLWHALAQTPDDLELRTMRDLSAYPSSFNYYNKQRDIIGAPGLSYLLKQIGAKSVPFSRKLITHPESVPPTKDLTLIQNFMDTYVHSRELHLTIPDPFSFHSSASQAALISRHWLPQEVALSTAGGIELAASSRKLGFQESHKHTCVLVLTNSRQLEP